MNAKTAMTMTMTMIEAEGARHSLLGGSVAQQSALGQDGVDSRESGAGPALPVKGRQLLENTGDVSAGCRLDSVMLQPTNRCEAYGAAVQIRLQQQRGEEVSYVGEAVRRRGKAALAASIQGARRGGGVALEQHGVALSSGHLHEGLAFRRRRKAALAKKILAAGTLRRA